jgi:hypothetical protein
LLRSLALLIGVAIAAVIAWWAVYGSEPSVSPLRGYVLLSALAGGIALAFSRPFLLVLVPYLTLLFRSRENERLMTSERGSAWRPLGFYIGAFAIVFVVTISGFPKVIAAPVYQSERLVHPVGGAVLLVWGLCMILGLPLPSVWRRVIGSGAGILGATTGVLMYHVLDPTYDSVFFSTGNAIAASHAPITVALFTAGLGAVYLAVGGLSAAVALRARWGRSLLQGGRILSGLATALIGLAIVTGQFGAIRNLLF